MVVFQKYFNQMPQIKFRCVSCLCQTEINKRVCDNPFVNIRLHSNITFDVIREFLNTSNFSDVFAYY